MYDWGYEWVEKSNNKVVTIDRGASSDLYESEIHLRGKFNEINSIYNFLLESRKVPNITMSGVNSCESPFGENINYTGSLNVIILDVEDVKQEALNSFTLSFYMRLVSFPLFVGNDALPSMRCLDVKDIRKREWSRHVQVSYFNDNYGVEKDNDIIGMEVTTSLSLQDTISILNFHRSKRGTEFIVLPEDWGIKGLYGQFNATMAELKVSYISPQRRQIKITLRRQ
jgi:hypothetical protein